MICGQRLKHVIQPAFKTRYTVSIKLQKANLSGTVDTENTLRAYSSVSNKPSAVVSVRKVSSNAVSVILQTSTVVSVKKKLVITQVSINF